MNYFNKNTTSTKYRPCELKEGEADDNLDVKATTKYFFKPKAFPNNINIHIRPQNVKETKDYSFSSY